MEPAQIQPKLSRCAILFVDLRGYTTICEGLHPNDVAVLLDQFYGVIGKAVHAYGGRVQNLAGDAVMAVFDRGALSNDADGQCAVESGRHMIESFLAVGAQWESAHGVATGIGVGIHLGMVTESELCPPTLRRPSFVGDTVNVAARLCHRARAGEVLFSAEVATELSEHANLGVVALPNFNLRGRSAPVRIYCIPAPERPDPSQ